VRNTFQEYEGLDCKVFGISTDSPFALDAWAKDQRLQFTLMSDYNRDVSAAYDSLYEELMGLKGVSKRAAYVIDREGKIRYSFVCPDPRDLPDFEEIKKCLRSIP
jgi:glutaredoxin-dependent peroxiredoxin